MENWVRIFIEAKRIVLAGDTIEAAVAEGVAVARRYPRIFDEPKYWDRVKRHDFGRAFRRVSKWAADAFSRFPTCGSKRGWQLVILDLGDCPEVFRAYVPGAQDKVSEEKLRKLFRKRLIQAEELEDCFEEGSSEGLRHGFFGDPEELADHNVSELKDSVLTWNDYSDPDLDHYENNGNFLWLIVGGLAFVQQARASGLGKKSMKGGRRLHIVIGFEELFSHFVTVK